jgi:DNA-binding PadR family transcriptional regulator
MTPNDIEILIHYYVSPNPHPRIDAGAVKQAVQAFVKDGIFIEADGDKSGYSVTDKGKAWLATILNVPYPKKIWVDGRGNKVFE